MKKLIFATVAFAAALTAFAAQAKQTLPEPRPTDVPIEFGDTGDMRAAFKKSGDSAALATYILIHVPPVMPYVGVVSASLGVDTMTTQAIGVAAGPTLTAFARSETIIKGGEVGIAVGGKLISGGQYHDIVSRYAATYGVPVALAHAVIRVESNYRSGAKGAAGEIGLMQIKPATARLMGYAGKNAGLFNPETNIRYGMKYLGKAYRLGGGTTCGTILKYNAGHGAKKMNPVSAAYCKKVKRHLAS